MTSLTKYLPGAGFDYPLGICQQNKIKSFLHITYTQIFALGAKNLQLGHILV